MTFDPSQASPERTQQLGQLRSAIEACGADCFVSAHIVDRTPDYFPDPWTPDAQGVRALARRLLGFAGLGALEVEAESRRGDEPLWFVGLDGLCCTFAFDARKLGERPPVTPGWRETVRAYQTRHDVDTELRAAVAVCLGFGALAASDGVTGACFLLAVQAVVRDLDEPELDRMRRALGSDRAEVFRALSVELAGAREELCGVLGLPAPQEWPKPPPLIELTRAFDPDAAPGGPDLQRGRANDDASASPLVRFRVRRTLGRFVGVASFLAGGAGTLAIDTRTWRVPELVLLLPLVAGVVGWCLGALARDDYCSDPECESRIPRGAARCPKCGGRVVGEIARPRDRLAALEEYARAHRAKADP